MSSMRKFNFDHKQLVSFCDKFKGEYENYDNDAILEVKHSELERRWNKVLESFENLMTTTDEDDDENIHKFDEASEKYQYCKVKIIETIQNKLRPKVHESTRNDVSMTHQHVSNLKLPPCDTQPFEGGFSKWPAFRDIFQAVFINHPGLSQAQKLYHLRCKTRGEALQIVQRFDLVDSNFVLAWEALKNRYENTRILVHQQMKKLFSAPIATNETAKSIRQIKSCINDSVSIFKSFKVKTDDWDPILIHLCSTKLPEETLRAWEDSLTDHKELPSWSQLDAFLSKRIEILETITDFKKPNHKENQNSKSQIFYSQSEGENNNMCKKCKRNHSLRHCKQFKSLTPQERLKFVYANKYCANCLSPNHFKSKCASNLSCVKCKKKHHTLLHLEKYENNRNNHRENSPNNNSNENRYSDLPSSSNVSNEGNNNQNDAVQVHFAQNNGTTVLPTALINLVYAGEKFLVRALLDGGSERSFITKRIQQQLKLPIRRHNSQISGLGGTVVGNSNGTCYVEVQSRNKNFSMKINMIVVPKLAHFLPAKRVKVQDLGDLSNFELADPYFYKPSPIDVIIGSDYLPQINMEGIRLDIAQGLEVRESKFGWYLSGPMPISEINSFSTLVSDYEYTELNKQLKKFWEIEEGEFHPPENDNDSYCEEYFQRTTIRDKNGRYVVRLPFRPEFPQEIFLGASKKSALAQYLRMDKNLEKTPDLKKEYNKVLQEYIDLDHMEPVNHHEEIGEKQMSFFLPHHAVVKPDRKSTKVRVVFNGSKKTSNGMSLNNVLLQGPTLLTDLTQIILGWRFYQYVFTGDIEKMYRQILLHPEDRKYQLIFFRSNSDDKVKIYQLKTVTFGINCAPFLAIRSLIQLSEDCKENFELGSHVLRNETYVDDVLSGGHDIEEAKAKQLQLMQILKSAHFPLKKITSNNDLLLQHLAREDLLDEDFLKFDESSTTKTLGIRWNAKSDEFFYKVESIERNVVTTKRIILSVIARIYDPLGWLGPIIIIAKLLMQSLWQEKIDWNDPVPSNLLATWNKFVENLSVVSNVRIPRWVEFSPRKRIQLHGFSDASEKAYCGAIYIRVQNSEDVISSHLLIAKTKVAPLKSLTIPKLELCGALLMAKLMKSISEKYDFEKFYWTDSSIVLGWLQKSPQSLKTFVANRVTKINELSDVDRWRHVCTEDNPADLGTRGCTPQELQQNTLWWHGPPWLRTKEVQWPKPRTFDPTDIEIKKTLNFHLEIQNEDFINRFSSFNKAIRVLCQIYRFIAKCRHKLHHEGEALSTDEIIFAKHRLIIMAQKAHYAQEYEQLESKLPLSKKSTILALTPFLDKNGLIRVGGRLNNSGFSFEERHPVLIPDKSHLSTLFVNYTHEILLHAEHGVMLRYIRQGFYIPRLRNAIRKTIRNCRKCTIYKHKFHNQLMASLPQERVNFSPPFTYTGVDFAGPFSIKSSSLKNAKILKSYAAVFVCFTTRSVHLECCSDLSADAFLATFSRFVGRRGLPKTLFSDNGRNFIGANRKLLEEHNLFLKEVGDNLGKIYSPQGFTWSFIPPYAPHMGGLWEAAVKSMKTHLKKVTSNWNFTFEEFTTLLVRVEAVLNSRPLCPISEDPNELLPLTPGHFLRGASLTAPPESSTTPSLNSLSYINRWQRLKTLFHIFSQRWKSEYVTEMQRRYKWKSSRNNIKEGDVVIVKEESLPPTEWCLGRIVKTFCGKDNNVRVAEIKTKHGIIVRPIVKICLLPTSENTSLPKPPIETPLKPKTQ